MENQNITEIAFNRNARDSSFMYEVTQEEIQTAKTKFIRVNKLFLLSLLTYIVVLLVYAIFTPKENTYIAFLIGEILQVVFIGLSLFFVLKKGVLFAGRVFGVLWGVFAFRGVPLSYWSDSVFSGENLVFVLPLVAAFLVGWLIDIGGRNSNKIKFWLLCSATVQLLSSLAYLKFSSAGFIPYSGIISVLLLFIPVFMRPRRNRNVDNAELVFRHSMKKNNSRIIGKILAVFLIAFPLLMIINTLGTLDALDTTADETINTPRFYGNEAWFWSRFGNFQNQQLILQNYLFIISGKEYKTVDQNRFFEYIPERGIKEIDIVELQAIKRHLEDHQCEVTPSTIGYYLYLN